MTARARPSVVARRAGFAAGRRAVLTSLTFMFEVHHAERRERYANRMITSVRRHGVRVDAAIITHAASTIVGRIRIDDLTPVARLRHAEEIVLARHGREVAGDEDRFAAVSRSANERERALVGIAA